MIFVMHFRTKMAAAAIRASRIVSLINLLHLLSWVMYV